MSRSTGEHSVSNLSGYSSIFLVWGRMRCRWVKDEAVSLLPSPTITSTPLPQTPPTLTNVKEAQLQQRDLRSINDKVCFSLSLLMISLSLPLSLSISLYLSPSLSLSLSISLPPSISPLSLSLHQSLPASLSQLEKLLKANQALSRRVHRLNILTILLLALLLALLLKTLVFA